jgi:hypothetical protein
MFMRVGVSMGEADIEGADYFGVRLLVDRDRPGDVDRARPMAHDARAVAGGRGYGYVEAQAAAVVERLA